MATEIRRLLDFGGVSEDGEGRVWYFWGEKDAELQES